MYEIRGFLKNLKESGTKPIVISITEGICLKTITNIGYRVDSSFHSE